MKYEEDVIGIAFTDVLLAESGAQLTFTGMALETGVWTDSHGTTLFYPLDVIHRSSYLFIDAPILCRHMLGEVGRITEVKNTENGMQVKGIVTHLDTIKLVADKTLRGLSVGMRMRVDPVKRMLLEVILAREISLVEHPACKVCFLNDDATSQELSANVNGDTMVEEKEYDKVPEVALADPGTEEYPMPDCEEFKEDMQKFDACQEFTAAVSIFKKAQSAWNAIFGKRKDGDMDTQNEEINMKESKTTAELSTQEVDIKEEVELSQADIVEVEVEASADVEIEVEAEAEVEIEAEAETVTEVEVEQSAEVLELTAELSEVKQLLEDSLADSASKDVKFAELAAELSITKSQLKTIEDSARADLVESVMMADPNADVELITNMSNVQLEAYKETVSRLSKPKVGSVRKTINATEKSVEMSHPVPKSTKVADGVIGYLLQKQ